MASIPEFEKRYLETDGISVYFYLIKTGKHSGKWHAHLLNKKEGEKQPFNPDSIFGIFDQVIKYIGQKRKPNTAKYKMSK